MGCPPPPDPPICAPSKYSLLLATYKEFCVGLELENVVGSEYSNNCK